MAVDVVSVLVSTVAGGAGGIVFASLKTGREEKAKRHALAKDLVHDVAADQLRVAVRYQAGYGGRRPEEHKWLADYEWASEVATASQRLGWIRQRLVRRRLEILVGTVACELAFDAPAEPGEDDDNTRDAVTAFLKTDDDERHALRVPQGLLDVALRKPTDSKEVKILRLHLKRLAQAW